MQIEMEPEFEFSTFFFDLKVSNVSGFGSRFFEESLFICIKFSNMAGKDFVHNVCSGYKVFWTEYIGLIRNDFLAPIFKNFRLNFF